MPLKPRVVSCPACGDPVPWTPESRWRPFCSKRCKMTDLGAWATEQYRVPVTGEPDALQPEEPQDDRAR